MIFLSVTNAPEHKVANSIWTYVEEPRYYAFVTLFIQQLVFIFLFNKKEKKNIIIKFFTAVCSVFLAIQILHGIFFVSKKLATENYDFTMRKREEAAQSSFYILLDSLQNKRPDKEVISVSSDVTFQNLAVLKGQKALYKINSIDELTTINSKIIFLVVLQEAMKQRYKYFLEQPNTKFISAAGGYYFYTLER